MSLTEENKKNPGGAPPFYETIEELQKKINKYLTECPDTKMIILKDGGSIEVPALTITGLAIYLGFCSRQSFYDYEKNEKFSYSIKRARLFIEREYEKQLSNSNASGAIFALKNFGWTDKQEVEHSGEMKFDERKTIVRTADK